MTRLRVREFYGRVWKEYADPSHHPITERSLAMQREIVSTRILWTRPGRILDLGCGPEPVIQTGQAPVVVHADIVPDMLSHIRRTRHSLVVCLDALHLPFRSQTFDLLWCGLLSDHLRDLSGWFSELQRVLSTGGTLGMACWDRSRLPPDRYPDNRKMSYTTSLGDELTVESLPNWEEVLRRMRAMDPGTKMECHPVLAGAYHLQIAFSRPSPHTGT
jgi:SAM-dependent methyltransferase